ncbi:hypothetical protein AVEN_204276-1 [Araneus ventricosus]|uniref:Uncharacterized protein n=1 Tax=Araneus ventricosus TaxID=182803 RepID=A0A4Y2JNA4_ARAVE|nr:hypothetical protein AVEN_204276-1 [Araneus ventricosus]
MRGDNEDIIKSRQQFNKQRHLNIEMLNITVTTTLLMRVSSDLGWFYVCVRTNAMYCNTIGAKVSGFRNISNGLGIDFPVLESREKIIEKVKVTESLTSVEIKKPEKRFPRYIIYDIPKAKEQEIVFHSLSQTGLVHVEHLGNEKADKLAKEAITPTDAEVLTVPLPRSQKHDLKQRTLAKWQIRWDDGINGSSTY